MTESSQTDRLAKKVLDDPILLRKLSDRIYELMLEDLRNQRDRFLYPPRS